ncbi:zinc finger protein [Gossypium australe]|uniref:Zinc finger protein n=1 Tax=Gossypium australe TaxID=47621 RepID=A0A5B6WJR5_9ROSI|nr:zinc finger protein [Gossypium australe]
MPLMVANILCYVPYLPEGGLGLIQLPFQKGGFAWIRRIITAETLFCSWSTTYEELLSTNEPFSEPIPLPEMVDFLVDIWHDDGLYD